MLWYYRIRNTIKYYWWEFRSKCMRFKRGYAWVDVWNMENWFMRTVKPMLIHLKDNGVGYPMAFKSRDEWCAVLDEMINCLEMMDEDNVRDRLGFGDDGAWIEMTQEDYINVGKTMEDNKNSFFRLFSEYFYDLWD